MVNEELENSLKLTTTKVGIDVEIIVSDKPSLQESHW